MKNILFVLGIIIFFAFCKKEEEKNTQLQPREKPQACFSFTPNSNVMIGDTIKFTNCSTNSLNCIWNFGDGTYSSDSITKHIYNESGKYEIQLIVFQDSLSDTIKQILNINLRPVLAGIVNANMYNEKYSPEKYIHYSFDSCSYGKGYDSIDFYNDGIFEISIEATFIDYASFGKCCPKGADCMPVGSEYKFIPSKTFEIAIYNEYFNFYSVPLANSYEQSDRIDTIKKWQNKITKIWSNDIPYPHQGLWYNFNNDRYLALRTFVNNKYKYGWIRIGSNTDHNLIYKEYAIEK